MRLLALIATALAAAGCTLREADRPEPLQATRETPPWLDATYADGTLRFDYPGRWKTSSSETFGGLVLDNVSPHPAFVSVRYLGPGEGGGDVADLLARTLRPPDGRGLTLLYAQTAYVGGRRSREVGFMWSTRADTPAGPTLRAFATPLPDGRTALLVFASERPRQHGGVFRWVRETLRWDAPVRSSARPPGGRIPAHA